MAIRLVALDLDRTLLGLDGKLSQANRRAVSWAQSRGVTVTLVTGRRFPSARHYAAELGIDAPLIAFGGAYVARPDRSQVYAETWLERQLVRGVCGFAFKNRYPLMAYTVDRLLSTDRETALTSGLWRPDGIGECTPEECETGTFIQLLSVGERAVEGIGDFLAQEFAGRFRYDKFTHEETWTAHLRHHEVSKGRALAELALRLGVDQSEVLAMGDERIDIDMVEWAGTGIAMAWSAPELLDVADDVTDENDPDGVATMLYRYLR